MGDRPWKWAEGAGPRRPLAKNLFLVLSSPMASKRKLKQAARQEVIEPSSEIEYAAPDPSTKITWPRHLAGGVDESKFLVLWPNNINSKKSLSQGRRISIQHACEDPIVQEMSEVCQFLKLTHIIEPYKALSRDISAHPGRIRVQIFSDDKPCHVEIESRKGLMRKMGELIPKLNIRKHRVAMEQRELDAQRYQAENGNSPGNPKGYAKKKGKKGRR